MSIDLYEIRAHLLKAERKHPKFCDKLSQGNWAGALESIRVAIATLPLEYADNAAMEELCEVFEAYDKGEKEHAIDECYDLIAVALRIVERIMNEFDTNSSESGN